MRKHLLVVATLLLLVSIIAGAKPLGIDLFGTWVNVDPDSGGTVQLVFLPNEQGGIQVYGYGVCDPSPCDWGATPLYLLTYPGETDTEWGMAIWDFGDGMLTVAIIYLAGEYMVVESYSLLGPDSGGMRSIELLKYVP